jgi:tyrosine-protein phosphatase non-receptor type 11
LVEHFILKETLRDKNDGTILVLKYPLSYKEPTTERYYHGCISGTDATNLLLEKAKPGSYLVRESRSDPQNYVLCVRCENNKIVHLIISFTVSLEF